MCANNLGTFIGNDGYHFEEEIEINLLEPRNGSESVKHHPTKALPRDAITVKGGISRPTELPPAGLAPFEPSPLARARRRSFCSPDCAVVMA